MPINYGTNDVTTSGLVNISNIRISGNTISSTNSNGNIIIQPSGTGALQRDSGGNARGQYAIDWQIVRSTGTMIAGGNYSVIGGGKNNTSSAYYSTVCGGYSNTASGFRSTIGGGKFNVASSIHTTIGGGDGNIASSYYTTVGGGYKNTSSAYAAVVVGGRRNTASGYFSSVIGGSHAESSRRGQISHAAGSLGGFYTIGDAQHSMLVLRNKTSGSPAGLTELALDGGSNYITIPSSGILSGQINITGSKSDGSAVARYLRQFTIKRVGNTTSLVGSVITVGTDEAAGTQISVTANDASDYLSIRASGVNNETWSWVAVVDCVEMRYGT